MAKRFFRRSTKPLPGLATVFGSPSRQGWVLSCTPRAAATLVPAPIWNQPSISTPTIR
ncbi:hypothetical protein I551_5078 [Mycobacterium ulcerans str. Harvey]|uniref:Uncharacterized protein n=1 Tax=Mycobacterium ulcerans str. Harvey TaxID=1299332 RepID=A0ABN0QUM9_MYCUL|nr:hypothetical protein I551_5078 [Mycobacterium ulcerans str. Harvey]